MPELPEVETIRNTLIAGDKDHPPLIGKRFEGASLLWQRSLAMPEPAAFLARLMGQQIVDIERRGKYFVFRLTEENLLIHLRMSGDLLLEPQQEPIDKTCRVTFFLDDGWRLAFNDQRKFGRVWLVKDPDEATGDLGIEPLTSEFTAEWLSNELSSRSRQLKPLLLDQKFIAGLGNIYTDEALHRAGLHPKMLSNRVDMESAHRLWESIQHVLQEGIRHNGSSIDWVYRGGEFQNYFRVYDRAEQPCYICGKLIERIVVGQRGTHLCPNCQPEPRYDE